MHPNWLSVWKSGVVAGCEKSIGVGRSTVTPWLSSCLANLSNSSFARSMVSCGRRPHWPRISESSGTLASRAGSAGGIWQSSARPTITCFSGSHSFHEFTTVFDMPPSKFMQKRMNDNPAGLTSLVRTLWCRKTDIPTTRRGFADRLSSNNRRRGSNVIGPRASCSGLLRIRRVRTCFAQSVTPQNAR